MSKNEEMNINAFLEEMEKLGREKGQVHIKTEDDGVGVEMSGSFNPINVLAMLDSAIKSLAKSINLEKDELIELYRLSVSKIGLDVGMVGHFLMQHLLKKEGENEQK